MSSAAPEYHSISDVSEAARTGTCSRCGPGVRVWRLRGTRWQCATPTNRRRQTPTPRLAVLRADRPALGTPCAICGDGTLPMVWDHDHVTGEFRGWICGPCNSGLGFFHDDPAAVAGAARYLLLAGRR